MQDTLSTAFVFSQPLITMHISTHHIYQQEYQWQRYQCMGIGIIVVRLLSLCLFIFFCLVRTDIQFTQVITYRWFAPLRTSALHGLSLMQINCLECASKLTSNSTPSFSHGHLEVVHAGSVDKTNGLFFSFSGLTNIFKKR